MNPNQLPPYQPYSGQYKATQYTNYQNNNVQQSNESARNINPNSNPYSSNNFQSDFQQNRNRMDRAMYSSSIQPTNMSKNFGLGKLQSMGRVVQNESSFEQKQYQGLSNQQYLQPPIQQFREPQYKKQQQKVYMAPKSQQIQFDRFPAFNIQQKPSQQQSSQQQPTNFSFKERQYNNISQVQQKNQTPEEKKKRQIMSIRQELQIINKKMESANIRKYNQTANSERNINTNTNMNINLNTNTNNNNSVNINTNNNASNNSFSNNYGLNNGYQPSQQNQQAYMNQPINGLTFSKSNQLPVYERNKGLATQSMIVSNEPSQGFKSQSIFDKYESLKKPTFQTAVEKKDDKSSLLDKFVKQGNSFNFNKQSSSSDLSNNDSESTNNRVINGNNTQPSVQSPKNNQGESNNQSYNKNYSAQLLKKAENISIQKNAFFASNTPKSPINYDGPAKQGGMFKKKKENPYVSDLTQNSQFKPLYPTSPKSIDTTQTSFGYKKTKEIQENHIVTQLKHIKLTENVEFKKDDFAIGKKLGKGQFGQVMLVQHKKTGFLCGMKIMQKKQIRDQKYQSQIARQLSIQFYLSHRNITPLYGYFQDQKNVYLLVQYCTSGQLLQMLRKNRRMQQPQVSRVIRQIIQGIDYIHRELIIHRDIKPQNILFNFGVAKICDYGWAVYKGHGMRKTASVGSPLYYSPEIVMGVEYDEKIDIWDIGMMTYECLLGKIPFRIYSELDLNRIVQDQIKFPQYIDTTDEAKDFILKIMKKKPEQRMEIKQMLKHPFITKYQETKLSIQIMRDFKEVLSA